MYSQNFLTQCIRKSLIVMTMSAFAVSMPALAANGQSGPANQGQTKQTSVKKKAQTLPTITVTGSHIPRTETITSQPVLHISHEEIEDSGVKTVGQFLDNMTSVGFVQGPAEGAFYGDGSEQVDLRYLGSNRLLVLLNGKRMPSSFGGSVDLNQIPISIIQRIDVLQDGASAVYGSDAIAGVINIITKKHFNGAKVSAYYGVANGPKSGAWDGNTQHFNFMMGRSGDKGHVLFDASYFHADAIPASSREFSTTPAVFGHSRGGVASPEGNFFFWAPTEGNPFEPGNVPAPYTGLTATQCPDAQTTDAAGATVYIPNCALAKTPLTSGTSPTDFHPFTNKDRYIAGSQKIPITYDQRIKNLFVQGSYDVTPSVTLNVSALYNDRQTTEPLDSDLIFYVSPGLDIGPGQFGNPFNFPLALGKPQQVATAPGGAPVVLPGGTLQAIYRTTNEAGIRVGFNDVTTERFQGGFKGLFSTGNIDWDWNADYSYLSNRLKGGETNLDKPLGISLASSQACYQLVDCVPVNLFGGQGVNGTGTWTPAMLAEMMQKNAVTVLEHKNVKIIEGGISTGNLVELPAGGLGLAVGYQRRDISGASNPPGLNTPNRNNPAPALPLSGSYHINSVYAELHIPLLSRVPGAYYLSTDLASRFEDFSTFGKAVKSRFGLLYQPVRSVAFRAGWSQGFRAADLSELFSPASIGFPYVTDPCSDYTAAGTPSATMQNCKAAGVPSSYAQNEGQVNGIFSGNVKLKPETSTSKTVGVVYSPSQLPGFNVSLDYYHIDLTQEIASFGGQQILDFCYKEGLPQFCGLVQRNPSGTIQELHVTSANIGQTRTAGYDFTGNYRFPETPFGSFRLKANVTRVNYFDEYNPRPDGTVAITRVLGDLDYGTIPRLKGYLALNYKYNRLSAALIGHYYSGFTGTCSDAKNGTPISLTALGFCSNPDTQNNALSTNHRQALSWFDLHLSYRTPWNVTFSGGVNNILGQTPKGNQDGYGNVATLDYGVYSRFVYGQVSYKF